MSNVIKSYNIRYEQKNKTTIEYKEREEELQRKRNSKLPPTQVEEGFEKGLQALVVEPIEDETEIKKSAGLIIENAKKEAVSILEEAKAEGQRLEAHAREEGKKQGYEEGLRNGAAELQNMKDKLIKQEKTQKEEYQRAIAGIEGQVTELLIAMITKLTGIFVEDKTDIILYLVERALTNEDSLDNYTILISREDFDILSSKKEYIEGIIGKEIQIVVDAQLTKNQCLIETDNKVINCSLDVQLNNLITDLKLLSSV